MGSFSDYFEGLTLDLLTGKNPSTARWLALFTVTPTDSTAGTECAGGSYARKQTAASDWNAAGTDGTTENATVITFVTPSGSWGTANGFAIMDAATAGNMLAWSALTVPQTISTGNTVSFAIGTLVITLD